MGIIAAHTSEISVIYIFNYKIKWDANGGDRTFCKCDQNVHDKLKAVIMSADSLEGSMNTGIQFSAYPVFRQGFMLKTKYALLAYFLN